jgi:hypothetical protein
VDWCRVAFATFDGSKPAGTADAHGLYRQTLFFKSFDDALKADTMTADDYEVGTIAVTHVAMHGRRQRVCAITLDETPRGVAKMHMHADEPPSSHVVNEFVARCVVDYAQDETAIRTCYRSARRSINTTHAVNLQESTAPSKLANKEYIHPRSVKATLLVRAQDYRVYPSRSIDTNPELLTKTPELPARNPRRASRDIAARN